MSVSQKMCVPTIHFLSPTNNVCIYHILSVLIVYVTISKMVGREFGGLVVDCLNIVAENGVIEMQLDILLCWSILL